MWRSIKTGRTGSACWRKSENKSEGARAARAGCALFAFDRKREFLKTRKTDMTNSNSPTICSYRHMETTGYPAHKGGTMTEKLLAHRHDLLLRERLRGHPPRHEQGRGTGVHPSSQPLSPHRLFRLCTDEWRSERKILCTGEESFAKGT